MENSSNNIDFRKRLTYREVEFSDCNLLFEWTNDPDVRLNSHNKEPVHYENHVTWLKNKLASSDSWLYIFSIEDEPVAILRLDKRDDDVLISYSVTSEFRGKGIGKEIIFILPKLIKDEGIQCNDIIAEVFKTNGASNKIFTSARYIKREEENIFVYTRVLK